MINEESLQILKEAKWTSHFQRPLYRNYAFSCLPDTLSKLLIGEGENPLAPLAVGGDYKRYDCVVLFLIDGFGWEFFERYRHQLPALGRFTASGMASQISSQFPSTTAAHLTSLHTGKEVGETGIYEWFQYEPLVDRMIAPVLVSYAGDYEAGGLVKAGYRTEALFPFETWYHKLARKGVRSIALQQEKIAQSAYSQALLAGSELLSYGTFSEALDRVVEQIKTPVSQPTYLFVYFGEIDAIGHRHGVDSAQFREAVAHCWTQFEDSFWSKIQSVPNKTAVIVTADHGMTAVDPKTTLFLNTCVPDLPSRMKRNREGMPLVPAGSCRDFFLHVEEDYLHQTAADLSAALNGKAEVIPTQILIEQGFFGSKPVSERLKDRVGNLVILPYKGQNVFWHFEKHRFEQHFYGSHGGLTPEEMISLFLFMDTSHLLK